MNTILAASVVGGVLLLLLDLALSVALVSVSALSHVSLRRIGSESGLDFLELMQRPQSRHRAATEILRQFCLVGAVLLFALAARSAGMALPVIGGVAAAAMIGVLLLETLAARAIALHDPRAALRYAAPAVRLSRLLLFPVVEPLHAILARIERRQSSSQTEEEREDEQEEDVEALIEVGEREGLLEAEEGEMLRGIVDLDETKVREIMTPRPDIVALEQGTPVAEARRIFLEAGHSRLPVYQGTIDTVVGVLHSRDLFRAWEAREEQEPVARYLRPVDFVPEMSSARELLGRMRQRSHLAVVVDEYGGVAGLVTLEDLLEEIVGDIRDEHDDEEETLRPEADGSWTVAAVVHVKELETLFDVEFGERDFDTVGGLVVFACGRVPVVGETIQTHGLSISVLEADRRRIHRVRVRRVAGEQAEVAG